MTPAFISSTTLFPIFQPRTTDTLPASRVIPLAMATPPARPQICVVGAGLAGLAVSIGLADRGCSVDLLERRSTFSAAGSAFALHSNGNRALREIAPDAVPAIEEAGIVLPGDRGHLLLWGDVRDALVAAVSRRDGIRLRMGVEVERIEEEEGYAKVAIQTDGKIDILPARLVLGCDGVNSGVRKLLGRKAAKSSWATTWRGTIKVPDDSTLVPLLGKGILPTSLHTSRGWYCLLFNFNASKPGMMAWAVSTIESVEENCNLWATLEPHFTVERERALFKEVLQLSPRDELEHQADMRVNNPTNEAGTGWGGRGRVALMGDAAHAMCPASGLGGSMAFEDAVALCRIVQKLGEEEIGGDVVERFEAERLPRVAKIWEMEWKLTENN